MAHHQPVKSIHGTLLCSLPLSLIQRILLYLTIHFPWLFSFHKIIYMLFISFDSRDSLLKNWPTVLLLFRACAIFLNFSIQFRLLFLFQRAELFNSIFLWVSAPFEWSSRRKSCLFKSNVNGITRAPSAVPKKKKKKKERKMEEVIQIRVDGYLWEKN